ncbi:MAG: Rdx family protein [Acidobacteriaceae bacterium]|nr:Rdx family protein [Acidobacteriaceae bacterium]
MYAIRWGIVQQFGKLRRNDGPGVLLGRIQRAARRTGGPGALDVFIDGEQIYSKKKTGRMPRADELIAAIRSKLPGTVQ